MLRSIFNAFFIELNNDGEEFENIFKIFMLREDFVFVYRRREVWVINLRFYLFANAISSGAMQYGDSGLQSGHVESATICKI